ncbi:unnamed protein product [Caretta caretta]
MKLLICPTNTLKEIVNALGPWRFTYDKAGVPITLPLNEIQEGHMLSFTFRSPVCVYDCNGRLTCCPKSSKVKACVGQSFPNLALWMHVSPDLQPSCSSSPASFLQQVLPILYQPDLKGAY